MPLDAPRPCVTVCGRAQAELARSGRELSRRVKADFGALRPGCCSPIDFCHSNKRMILHTQGCVWNWQRAMNFSSLPLGRLHPTLAFVPDLRQRLTLRHPVKSMSCATKPPLQPRDGWCYGAVERLVGAAAAWQAEGCHVYSAPNTRYLTASAVNGRMRTGNRDNLTAFLNLINTVRSP